MITALLILVFAALLLLVGRILPLPNENAVSLEQRRIVEHDYCEECKSLVSTNSKPIPEDKDICKYFCELPIIHVSNESAAQNLSGMYKMVHHTSPKTIRWVFDLTVSTSGDIKGRSICVMNNTWYMDYAVAGLYIGSQNVVLVFLPLEEESFTENQAISLQLEVNGYNQLYGSTTGNTVIDDKPTPTFFSFAKDDKVALDYFD
jgi:hypothetical protein